MDKEIKLFISGFNGVWTDNLTYYDKKGNETKYFNSNDCIGVMFLNLNNIPIIILTEDHSEMIKSRLEKMKITDYFVGVNNKIKVAQEILNKYNITWEETAYIGDDINDLPLLKKVGYAAVPAQAPYYVKREVDVILSRNGGEGAFREFVEKYMDEKNMLKNTLDKYLSIYEAVD